MSWDNASDALMRIAEQQRWEASGRPTGPGPASLSFRAAELRRQEEDRWLAEQIRLAAPEQSPESLGSTGHVVGAAVMFLVLVIYGSLYAFGVFD
jgi:hypothetical protein